MRILLIAVICIAFSFEVYAYDISNDIYDKYNDYERYSGNSGGGEEFFSFIFMIATSIWAYRYLLLSYVEWEKRKAANEKLQAKVDSPNDWRLSIIGYVIMAVFISLPILVIVKWITNAATAREIWYLIYIPSFLLLTYLRKNGYADWDRWVILILSRTAALIVLLGVLIVMFKLYTATESTNPNHIKNTIISNKEPTQLAPRKDSFAAVDNHSKTTNQMSNLSPIKTEHSIQINNTCREQVFVSITYWNGKDWVTEGWWNIAPFSRIDTGSKTNSKDIYAYATSASYTWAASEGSGLARPISKESYTSSTANPIPASDAVIAYFLLASVTDNSDSSRPYYEFTLSCPNDYKSNISNIAEHQVKPHSITIRSLGNQR